MQALSFQMGLTCCASAHTTRQNGAEGHEIEPKHNRWVVKPV